MKDYSKWMTVKGNDHVDTAFDMCEKESVKINDFSSSASTYECIINDANEWQKNVDIITLFKKDIYTIKTGDNIQRNNRVYVVNFDIEDRDAFWAAKSRLCQSSLKWLNDNGQIKEAWFTLKSDAATNFGIAEGRIISLGNERRTITIQSNVDTMQIKDKQRFIFDERVWEVTAKDGLQEGLITLTLEESVFNDNDDKELRIADYKNNVHIYTLEIINGDIVYINNGSTVQLEVVVKHNGAIVDNPKVTYTSNNPSIATVSNSGMVTGISVGQISIFCTLDSDNTISDSIDIGVVSNPVYSYSITIGSNSSPANAIKNNTSKIYEAIVYNNGTPDNTQKVIWQLFADDQSSNTSLAKITSQDGASCTVKNNAVNSGYVQLKATLESDPSIVAWFRIQMMPLF